MDEKKSELRVLADKVSSYFKFYPNFPKDGILFWDVFSIYGNKESFGALVALIKFYANELRGKIDIVAGIDSRGFLIGPFIAAELDIIFIPLRKKGKLPGNVKAVNYELEYGVDTIEVQIDAVQKNSKILIVDDITATGGTMAAAVKLLKSLEADIVECMSITDVPGLRKVDIGAKLTVLCGEI